MLDDTNACSTIFLVLGVDINNRSTRLLRYNNRHHGTTDTIFLERCEALATTETRGHSFKI